MRVRLTLRERAVMDAMAAEECLDLSSWVRSRLLSYITSKRGRPLPKKPELCEECERLGGGKPRAECKRCITRWRKAVEKNPFDGSLPSPEPSADPVKKFEEYEEEG